MQCTDNTELAGLAYVETGEWMHGGLGFNGDMLWKIGASYLSSIGTKNQLTNDQRVRGFSWERLEMVPIGFYKHPVYIYMYLEWARSE